MLGTTAQGIFWMFRYLERSENTARLLEAGQRIALTRASTTQNDEWKSVLATAGCYQSYTRTHGVIEGTKAIDYLLRDRFNKSSVLSVVTSARENARLVRTALTREVWEATNNAYLAITDALAQPVTDRDLPQVLGLIRSESAYVRGVLHGTMLRNEIYDFARIGTFVERADSTARILDVKYYVLLPSASHVGSQLDNVQWETILRSVSAHRSYRWLHPGRITPSGIADMLILNRSMPRSLAFCFVKIRNNLGYLASGHGEVMPCHQMAADMVASIENRSIESIFDEGLHEFLAAAISNTAQIAQQIEIDYRFLA